MAVDDRPVRETRTGRIRVQEAQNRRRRRRTQEEPAPEGRRRGRLIIDSGVNTFNSCVYFMSVRLLVFLSAALHSSSTWASCSEMNSIDSLDFDFDLRCPLITETIAETHF